MNDVSKIEFQFEKLSLSSQKIPSDDEIPEFNWNDDGKLFHYITNNLILKRIPNWKETDRRENSCSPNVDTLGLIRIFIENR